jgi:hypothetical protein
MVRLEKTPGLDGWGFLGSLYPKASNYTSEVKAAARELASFDFFGALTVVNVTITAAQRDAPFQVEVMQGPKKGRDVCFNQRGRDANGARPWADLPFSRKVTYALADTVAAMWENSDSDTTGLIGRKVHESLRQDINWTECSFTVTRYSAVTIKVTGAQVTVSTENVFDQMRILYQVAAMALLLNAEMISESLVVWCTSGAAAGSLVLTVLIIVLLFRKVDNNRRGVPILVVLGGGVWQLLSSFWHQYWQYVIGLYVLTGLFGCYYCYRHPLGETSMAMFAFSLQVVGLGMSYWAVADSGAGLFFMLSQLVRSALHCITSKGNLATRALCSLLTRSLSFSVVLQVSYELFTARRSILYTSSGIMAMTLYRLGIVSDDRLVSLGMMTRHKIFAHNNYLADESLSTPVRNALVPRSGGTRGFEPVFSEANCHACCFTIYVVLSQRDRSRAFHEQGKANADIELAKLFQTAEFKDWERKKRDAARWRTFEWAKRAAGALVLLALAIYAAHLNGWITLPSAGKFEF